MGLTICEVAAKISTKLAVAGFDALSERYPKDDTIQDSIFASKIRFF